MRFGAKSDKGMVREINEDSYNIIASSSGNPVSFIIADGMGGHNAGEVASKMAVDFVSDYILQLYGNPVTENDIPDAVTDMMNKANTHVFKCSVEKDANAGMGTTLIIAMSINGKMIIGHIGDSRVYLIRNGELSRITTDHSLIEELIRSGTISKEEAGSHPGRNIITRALGCSNEIQVDLYLTEIRENDIFILCTDGLSNILSEAEIYEIIAANDDPELSCTKLVGIANEKGGNDNITVIIVKND